MLVQHGATPLCIAAQLGHFSTVMALLAAGADVNQVTQVRPAWAVGAALVLQQRM